MERLETAVRIVRIVVVAVAAVIERLITFS